jgi:hypothetical protein
VSNANEEIQLPIRALFLHFSGEGGAVVRLDNRVAVANHHQELGRNRAVKAPGRSFETWMAV